MPTDFQPVQQFIDRIVEQRRVPGAGIAIAIDGKAGFTAFSGEASPGNPATADTLWPLASISKLFTASAIMSLIEQGALALSTKASAVFPEFSGGGREEITLRHLLTHTSGLGFAPANIAELLQAGATAEELISHGYSDPLLFKPGTGQSYSDTGYGLAGLMAAKVAGMPFPELIRTRVLEPAGSNDTFLGLPAEEHHRVARVAGANGEGTDWAIYSSLYGSQIGHPAYGVVATVDDVLRFLLHFDPQGERRLHSRAGLRTMTTDQTFGYRSTAEDYPIFKWGAGFALQAGEGDAGIASSRSYGHLGGTGCAGWIDPEYGVSVAFVSNSHANRGRDEWLERMEEAGNVAVASVTEPVDRSVRAGFGR
jgi:CubicO group peptidase (beta-lactamase class C family)